MVNNSLDRLIDAIAHVLGEEALPAIEDGAVRSNIAGALVLLDLIKRRAAWKPEFAEREESCRVAAFRKLPNLLAGTPFVSLLGDPPQRSIAPAPAESFMAGVGGYADDLDATTHLDHDFTMRMDDYVSRLIGALDHQPAVSERQRGPLRQWVLDYCIATVAASAEKSVTATVGAVTRSSH
ncbi:hypothetical protein SRS16P2_00186 (plasmid) [Variovorax sp. SRS16]|uniref:hypothetical protein n=1 Tax=Variovorax sp. SRS16 TaxID=282217 RepID=UPI0013177CC3|nr:hypothetical protein [Variovorax sp. SRS16]VTU45513.1 hypothetical protein SRS16P2_00186 [Variovorax sp. SRS16]